MRVERESARESDRVTSDVYSCRKSESLSRVDRQQGYRVVAISRGGVSIWS